MGRIRSQSKITNQMLTIIGMQLPDLLRDQQLSDRLRELDDEHAAQSERLENIVLKLRLQFERAQRRKAVKEDNELD